MKTNYDEVFGYLCPSIEKEFQYKYFSEDDTYNYYMNPHTIPDPGLDLKKFGEWLKAARERTGMRQEDLAGLLGINKTTLSNFETGKRKDFNPGIKTVYKIAYVLDVSIDWLCGFSEYPEVPTMTSPITKRQYVKMLIDLMERADRYKKLTRNNRYYKIPRRGLVYDLKNELEELEITYMRDERMSPQHYEQAKKEIWNDIEKNELKYILALIFDDKAYNKYSEEKAKQHREYEDYILTDDDLPF